MIKPVDLCRHTWTPINDGFGGEQCTQCGMLGWGRHNVEPLHQYVTVVNSPEHPHDCFCVECLGSDADKPVVVGNIDA